MYNYRNEITKDALDWMNDNFEPITDNGEIIAITYEGTEYDKEDFDSIVWDIEDELWIVDSITGNGSGSYTFNSYRAREYVLDNFDLLADMRDDWGAEDIGNRLIDEEWEYLDVSIRCYLLTECIYRALEEYFKAE